MAENIYEEGHSSNINTKVENITEKIYMNKVPSNSQQMMENTAVQDHPGGHNQGRYKWAVVFLGLLCAVLLTIIIGLGIKNEKMRQLQVSFNNLTEVKDQLETNLSTIADERDKLQRRLCKMESMLEIKVYSVDVTLDPDTAYRALLLSADHKQMRYEDIYVDPDRPENPERFDSFACVLGKEGFSFRKFYFEVDVTMATDWDLGIAAQSVDRKGSFDVDPKHGYWQIWLRNSREYEAIDHTNHRLSLDETPQVIGVFTNYEEGLISFYDADTWHLIYTFTNTSFTTKIYPSFCLNKVNETLIIKTN